MIYAMMQYLQSHSLTWLFSGRETQYICVGQKHLFFFFYWIFPFEHRDFSKDHLFICYEKMWKSCQNSIYDKSLVCALPCLFNMSVIAPKITF